MNMIFIKNPYNKSMEYSKIWLGYGYSIHVYKHQNCYQVIPIYNNLIVGEVKTEYSEEGMNASIESIRKDLNRLMRASLSERGIFLKETLL